MYFNEFAMFKNDVMSNGIKLQMMNVDFNEQFYCWKCVTLL